MKTLLCIPPQGYFAERWQDTGMPSLGILYMAAVLEKNGKPVEVLPANILKMTVNDVVEHIKKSDAGLVGITITTENRMEAFDVCRLVKQSCPDKTVIAGGPHCTNADMDTIEHIPEIDIVVRGEAEQTLVEIVECLENNGSLGSIDGITYRDENGRPVQNKIRCYIQELDDLPMPARHLDVMDKYNFYVDIPGKGKKLASNMMTSRGCPFNCNFCATPHNWGRKVRGFSPERVLEEIELLKNEYGVEVVWFYDDTFNYNPKRLETICNMIIERKLDINWWCEVRIDALTRDQLALMAKAGLYHVGFGVESANPRVAQNIIHKGAASTDKALQVIEWANELGVTPNPFFIFSHPTETYPEALETLKFAQSIAGRAECSLSVLHVYPGSELHRWALDHGQIPVDFSWTTKHDPRILELPEAQGHVPLFLDKLTWYQVSKMIFMFNDSAKKVSLGSKIQKAFKNCRSFRQFKVYFVMGLAFLSLKLKRMFGLKPV